MPVRPRRRPNRQLALFEESTSLPAPGAPDWTTLPDQTRDLLTGLVTCMLIAHVGAVAPEPEGDDDDV